MLTQLTYKVEEIADFFSRHLQTINRNRNAHAGICSGISGELLYLAYYNKFSQAQRHSVTWEEEFERFIERLSTQPMGVFTHSNGVSGVLCFLENLCNNDIVDISFSEFKEAYKPFVAKFISEKGAEKDFDYLHGALGAALAYVQDEQISDLFMGFLSDSLEEDKNGLKVIFYTGMEQEPKYNLSLSHGLSALIIYLSKFLAVRPDDKSVRDILVKTCDYLLAQRIDETEYGCLFPSCSVEPDEKPAKSRLAWCYGDMGPALALMKAGNVLSNSRYTEMAFDTMIFSAGRRSLADAMAIDAGLCHGTAGIAMMFRYFYFQTGEKLFLETADYWINETLKMSRFEDGIAGYKIYNTIPEPGWYNSPGFLEGVAGTGLALLGAVAKERKANNWTELLLLE